jgi:hypothetical protein
MRGGCRFFGVIWWHRERINGLTDVYVYVYEYVYVDGGVRWGSLLALCVISPRDLWA